MNKKWLLCLAFAVLVSVLVACAGDESAEENNDATETQDEESTGDSEEAVEGGEGAAEQPEMPEADLEDVPEVVAEVNGEEIEKREFETNYTGQYQQAVMQSQMSGQEVDQEQLKNQVVENMIGVELLIQEANSSNVEASEEDINQLLDELVAQNQLESQEEFITALEQQGMDEAEVMSQVETQVRINKLIANESDVKVSDEEVAELYEQYKAQQEQMSGEEGQEVEVPSLEEIRPDLVAQIKSQKEAEASQSLVKKLREDADVTNHL